jgi:hypothetical protein
VSGNGARKPPRPSIELLGGNPTEQEAAAVVAALERHLAETAPRPEPGRGSRWQQAALADGVSRDPSSRGGWGRGGHWG